MPKSDSYREALKQDFGELIDSLNLKERQSHYLRSRWLDQILWMEGRAKRAQTLYYRLRLTTIIGGVIIPALVSLNFAGAENPQVKQAIGVSAFVLSQVVAISAATEQFFNYGERWRHYRRSVETLKTQGWQFFQLSGTYQNYKTHDQAFNVFAGQVETILQRDVETYSTQVVQPKRAEKDEEIPNQEIATQPETIGKPTI
jgi:hypothetical protein